MLCDESSLSLEASGNKTCRINEEFSLSIQGKCVDVLPHIVECVGNVTEYSSWATASICYERSGALTTPALTWQEMRPVYLE